MSHKDKKVNPKTKKELKKMEVEASNEIGYSKESKTLGRDEKRPDRKNHTPSDEKFFNEVNVIMKNSTLK